jgi:hypothetical protein
MKHPVRADFDAAVTESGVSVTFKPTNSIYSFYRLAGASDIAPAGGGHAGVSGDTADYPPDEVQEMAQRIASEVAASVWRVQDQEEADRLTTVRPIVGDRGD